MDVEYEQTVDDIIAWNRRFQRDASALRARRWLQVTLFGVALPLAGLALLALGITEQSPGFAGWGLFILLFSGSTAALIFGGFQQRQVDRLVRRLYREGRNRTLFGRRRLSITPETITEATEVSVLTYKWQALERMIVDTEYVFFLISSASAIILPRRAFATEEAFRNFVSTARGYLNAVPAYGRLAESPPQR